ncbi:ceramide synthase 2-like [Panulirus ornatus]|uniref:ceramide synthase 2-like n=1 Tax=Panulirus ornatus TaxID=150431 RepID=UPI003A8B5E67
MAMMMKRYVDELLKPFTQHYMDNNTMVGTWWHQLSAIFWRPDIWLPPGVEWKDMESSDELHYPSFHDVCVYSLMLSMVIFNLYHFCLRPLVLEPLAQLAAIPNKRPRPPLPSKTLLEIYLRCGKKPSEEELLKASDSTGMSIRQMERWLRCYHAITHSTKHEKFIDCGFHLICHCFLTIFGCFIMFHKPWLWNILLCWENYPYHSIDDDVWWYYIIGLSYFGAATILQIQAPGRSVGDKVHMMLHHLFTVFLMVFSWTCNFVRVGTLVLLVHEFADIPLLSAKMFTYAGITAPRNGLFAVFLITWVITRCYLFPFWIIYSVYMDSAPLTGMPVAQVMKVVLCGLLVLNIIWTVLIGRVLMRKLYSGSLEDVRSDDEDLSDDSEETTFDRVKDE